MITIKKGNSKSYDREYIISLLSDYDWISEYTQFKTKTEQGIQQITAPDPKKSSYKKHITDLVKKTESNMRGVIDAGSKIKGNETNKLMWIYIDKVEFRFVITRWDGSNFNSR